MKLSAERILRILNEHTPHHYNMPSMSLAHLKSEVRSHTPRRKDFSKLAKRVTKALSHTSKRNMAIGFGAIALVGIATAVYVAVERNKELASSPYNRKIRKKHQPLVAKIKNMLKRPHNEDEYIERPTVYQQHPTAAMPRH